MEGTTDTILPVRGDSVMVAGDRMSASSSGRVMTARLETSTTSAGEDADAAAPEGGGAWEAVMMWAVGGVRGGCKWGIDKDSERRATLLDAGFDEGLDCNRRRGTGPKYTEKTAELTPKLTLKLTLNPVLASSTWMRRARDYMVWRVGAVMKDSITTDEEVQGPSIRERRPSSLSSSLSKEY